MTKERIVKPVVHQHLEKIEDQIVVDAIASKMGKYHDNDGQIYSHETGTSTQYAMSAIADACARAYTEGMSHEEVWQKAQAQSVEDAIVTGWKAMRDLGEDTPEGEGSGGQNEILRCTSAALHMYALDRQMGVITEEDDTPIDTLLDLAVPRMLRGIIKSQLVTMRRNGIIAQDGEHEPVSVAEVIERRPQEKRHEAWRRSMEKAHDSYADYEDDVAIRHTYTALYALRNERDPDVLDETCGRTLEFIDTLYGDSQSMALAALPQLPEEYLKTLYSKDGEDTRRFEAMLERAYGEDGNFHGRMLWKLQNYLPGGLTGEVAKAHPVIKKLRARYDSDASLLCAALPDMPSLVHPEEAAAYNDHMRDMIGNICVATFPDAEFARRYASDMIRSFEPRLWEHNEEFDFHAYKNDDRARVMSAVMNKLQRMTRTFGAERLMKLHERFDLGAIDVFSETDIKMLDILERGDPKEIAALREKDVTLVMFDAYGDHNNGMKSIADQLNIRDSTHERILMPWRKLDDFHESLATLRHHNVKPCTIAIANHGNPGAMGFNKGPEAFYIVSDMSVARDLELMQNSLYDMQQSQLEIIARRFMSLPRHTSSTGQPRKRWILASCASDGKPESDAVSVAEMGVRMINQVDVSVIATEDYATVRAGEDALGLHMFGNRTSVDEDSQTPWESNMVELRIDPASAWIRVERRPVVERVTP